MASGMGGGNVNIDGICLWVEEGEEVCIKRFDEKRDMERMRFGSRDILTERQHSGEPRQSGIVRGSEAQK